MRYTGSKFWNEMPEKILKNIHLRHNLRVYCVKKYLKDEQNYWLFSIKLKRYVD